MSTRIPRLTSRVTIPMRQEVVDAVDDAAKALGITRTEAIREATQNWLTVYHLPTSHAGSNFPEWVVLILEDEDLSNEGKIVEIGTMLKDLPLSEKDQRMIDRELHRQRIDYSRRCRAGLV